MTSEVARPAPSVLLSFQAKNVRSFRDEIKFSLLATALAEPETRRPVPWRENGATVDVLPVAAVFGANGSGKSNLLRALRDMRLLVLSSFRSGRPGGGVERRPFLLDEESVSQPSEFEIDMVLHGIRHRYGFAVNDERIVEEWAFQYPKGHERLIFMRDGDTIESGTLERSKTRAVREILRPNALFLSTAASANHPALLPLYNWFERNLLLAESETRILRQAETARMLTDEATQSDVMRLLREADLGITGVASDDVDPELRERMGRAFEVITEGLDLGLEAELPPLDQLFPVSLEHQGRNGVVKLSAGDESLGTMVWLGLVGPIVEVLRTGSVLLADELDASLHPALVAFMVNLFQSRETNPRRAQLIFNSHDTTLLGDPIDHGSGRFLGRDQVWFTEKERTGESRLYPLSDLSPRKGEAVDRRYIAGRYGAIPILPRLGRSVQASGEDHELATT